SDPVGENFSRPVWTRHDKKRHRIVGYGVFSPCLELFAHLGSLAHAVAQVVQLGPTYKAVTDSLDLVNGGRVEGEYLLHAHAVGQAADSERLLDAAVLLGDDSALEDLDTLAGALLDLHVDANHIAHMHIRHVLDLGLGQFFDEIHGYFPPNIRRSWSHPRVSLFLWGNTRQRTALCRHDRISQRGAKCKSFFQNF